MLPWPRSLVVVALLLPACSPAPPEVAPTTEAETSGTTASGGTSPVSPTDGSTTTAGGATAGSTDEPPGDTTAATANPTTDGESSSTGPAPGCVDRDDCGGNETCSDGRCVDACDGAWGSGRYSDCLDEFGDFDTSTSCGNGHLCVFWGDPIEQTACSPQGCVDACDCPRPDTGNATVVCGHLAKGMETTDCFLSCANGETCPDGMICNDSSVCTNEPSTLAVYGDCGAVAVDCTAPAYCIVVDSGEEVCTTSCNDVDDCPVVYPPGGDAVPACTDVVPDEPGFECYLSCVGGLSCPDGMTCVNGTLCMGES